MSRQEAAEQYNRALRLGQKEYRELLMQGRDPYPAVLNQIAAEALTDSSTYIGLVEIPVERIVGTRTAGRTNAFTASFLPLLDRGTEFATKWISLCADHLGEVGIREPIVCYEYYGDFYVQEGNKRVSVLRSYGAARIPGVVHRVMPQPSDEPRYRAYQEFMEFYKLAKIYDVQFTAPGGYARLREAIGIPAGQEWTDADRRKFRAYYQYFREAFTALGGAGLYISCADALLVWLEVYPYADLGHKSAAELKESLSKMWDNIIARGFPEPVVKTEPPSGGKSKSTILLGKLMGLDHLDVAFVHQRTAAASPWTNAHEIGRLHLQEALGRSVDTRSYYGADTPEQAEKLLEQAVSDGAEVIFTTTPQLIAPSLKVSVEHPRVRVLNCSVDMPYSTVRTYYGRIYEGKFITGAIAGAMARNDRIGYVGTYPTHGEPAAINAFALGAQLTNPRAVIELKWSCLKGNPTRELLHSGIRVISNRDNPVEDFIFTEYGTYIYNEDGKAMPLASPVWLWGKFYENVIRSILSGAWDAEKGSQAVNYWWGMNSGVIDVTLGERLPEGVRSLAQMLRNGLKQGTIDPFFRKICDQTGRERNDGSHSFSPDDLLHMDWLCENVVGHIPTIDEVIPESRAMVKLQGIYPEPAEEVKP